MAAESVRLRGTHGDVHLGPSLLINMAGRLLVRVRRIEVQRYLRNALGADCVVTSFYFEKKTQYFVAHVK
jgi:hypothetical protein